MELQLRFVGDQLRPMVIQATRYRWTDHVIEIYPKDINLYGDVMLIPLLNIFHINITED